MRELAISPIAPPDAVVRVPGSKSYTNRALVCASLADGTSRLTGWLDSDDTRAMIGALAPFGIRVEERQQDLVVHGTGGLLAAPARAIDCRASGTTMRFVAAMAALAPGEVVLDGTERMRKRPIQDLADGLRALGVEVRTTHGCPPVTVEGGNLRGGPATVDASQSSQFLSALLMVAPMASKAVDLEASFITSRPYVDMTIDTMSAFGIAVNRVGAGAFHIPSGQRYRPRSYDIEPDATAATYFFAAAAITGGRICVEGLGPSSLQSDVRFVDILERMGCSVERRQDAIVVRGSRYLHGVETDMNELPDSALTLAVVACFARGQTIIRNVPNLRIKETDRMAALEIELHKLGARVRSTASDLVIDPPERPTSARIATYDDHRMAMAFSVAGLVTRGIVIEDPGCVAKTFPDFFERLALLGR